MFGRAGSAGGGFDPGAQPGFGGFSDLFDAFFGGSAAGGGGVRRGRPGRRLRPPLRPADHLRGVDPGHGEGDRVRAPRSLRHLLGQRGEERDRDAGLPPVRRPRRDPPHPPDDARPDGQRDRLPALPGRGQDRRLAVRGLQRRGPQAAHEADPRGRSRPGSTTATRSASRPRARWAPAAVRRGASTSPSTWRRTPACVARGPSSTTSSTSRSPRRRWGPRSASRRPTARRTSRSSPAPSRGPRSACAAAGRRTCGGPGARGDLHVLVDVVDPDEALEGAARGARGLRRGLRRDERGHRQGRRLRADQGRPGVSAGPGRGAPDGRAGDGAWLELAVTCDPEAVEAVSEILARVAPGGVSVEPGFTLVDEGLGAAVDPSAPATVRAYLPARDAGGRAAAPRTRWIGRSATSRPSGCARSGSCGRRSSTRPTGPRPGSATSGSCGSGAAS